MATLQIWVNHQPRRSKCLGASNLTRLTVRSTGSTRVNPLDPAYEEMPERLFDRNRAMGLPHKVLAGSASSA